MKITRRQLRQLIKETVGSGEPWSCTKNCKLAHDHLHDAEKFVKDGNWSDARTAYADAMEIMVGGDETNVGIDNRDTGHALESIKKKQRDLNDPSYTLAADNK